MTPEPTQHCRSSLGLGTPGSQGRAAGRGKPFADVLADRSAVDDSLADRAGERGLMRPDRMPVEQLTGPRP